MEPFSHFREMSFTRVLLLGLCQSYTEAYWPRYVVIVWSVFSLNVIFVVVS